MLLTNNQDVVSAIGRARASQNLQTMKELSSHLFKLERAGFDFSSGADSAWTAMCIKIMELSREAVSNYDLQEQISLLKEALLLVLRGDIGGVDSYRIRRLLTQIKD